MIENEGGGYYSRHNRRAPLFGDANLALVHGERVGANSARYVTGSRHGCPRAD